MAVLVNGFVEVAGNLLLQIGVEPAADKQAAKTGEQDANLCHEWAAYRYSVLAVNTSTAS